MPQMRSRKPRGRAVLPTLSRASPSHLPRVPARPGTRGEVRSMRCGLRKIRHDPGASNENSGHPGTRTGSVPWRYHQANSSSPDHWGVLTLEIYPRASSRRVTASKRLPGQGLAADPPCGKFRLCGLGAIFPPNCRTSVPSLSRPRHYRPRGLILG